MTSVTRGSVDGFSYYGLISEEVELRMVPDLGAKIISLRHRPTNREWLWNPGSSPSLFRVPAGAKFADGPCCGVDECLPTIAPCVWQGRVLPDHGEAWTEPWTVDESALVSQTLMTRLRLPISPLAMTRSIKLDGSVINFHYALENLGSEPCDYVWALHPLLVIKPGDRLHLPAEVKSVRSDSVINCDLGELNAEWKWPSPLPGCDLSRLHFGTAPAAVKFFTSPLTRGWVEVANEVTLEFFRLEFNSSELCRLGVWINRGGWNGYHHLALEPTNGAPDSLAAAVNEWKSYSTLAPGETREWEVQIELGLSLDATASAQRRDHASTNN